MQEWQACESTNLIEANRCSVATKNKAGEIIVKDSLDITPARQEACYICQGGEAKEVGKDTGIYAFYYCADCMNQDRIPHSAKEVALRIGYYNFSRRTSVDLIKNGERTRKEREVKARKERLKSLRERGKK